MIKPNALIARKHSLALFLLGIAALALAGCAGPAAPEPVAVFPTRGAAPDVVAVGGEAEVEEALAPAAEPADFAGESGLGAEAPSQSVERLVIKNADLSLIVDDPEQSVADISKMAENMGGFVVSSNLYQVRLESGGEAPSANITIRVPAERFNEALTRLEEGANRVLSKNLSGQDVTQQYTDLQSRLRNLEDAEAQLREIMASATKTEDVLRVFNQLTSVREQIEVIKGQMQYFEQSADLSAISIQLTADIAVQPLTVAGWEPQGIAKEAIQALIRALQGIATAAIWLGLLLVPLALLFAIPVWLVWLGVRSWRARRKARAAGAEAEG